MTGVLVLLAALVLTAAVAVWRRRTDGRFTGARGTSLPVAEDLSWSSSPAEERGEAYRDPATTAPASNSTPAPTTWQRVAAVEPDAEPGERATLLQFSTSFCAPCRATRTLLSSVAEREDGVRHVEVDAEAHLQLVRDLGVLRTPTTLVLDGEGHEVLRASGAPRREQVVAALAGVGASAEEGTVR